MHGVYLSIYLSIYRSVLLSCCELLVVRPRDVSTHAYSIYHHLSIYISYYILTDYSMIDVLFGLWGSRFVYFYYSDCFVSVFVYFVVWSSVVFWKCLESVSNVSLKLLFYSLCAKSTRLCLKRVPCLISWIRVEFVFMCVLDLLYDVSVVNLLS